MNAITIGGITVGIMILASNLIKWWPGLKPLQKDPIRHAGRLLPFLLAWAYGALTILGIGGAIGWLAHTARWITTWLGDVALFWGVGIHMGQPAGRATYLPLTQTGGAIVLILTAIIIVAAKKSSKYGGDLVRGTWCGITLGMSAGVAGFAAAPLALGVNWLGDTLYGAMV